MGTKLSSLGYLLGADLDAADKLLVLDVSDGPTGEDKTITIGELSGGVGLGSAPSDILPVAKLTGTSPNGGPAFYDPASTAVNDSWWTEVDSDGPGLGGRWFFGDGNNGVLSILFAGDEAEITFPGVSLLGSDTERVFTITSRTSNGDVVEIYNQNEDNILLTINPGTTTGGFLTFWGGADFNGPYANFVARSTDAFWETRTDFGGDVFASVTSTRERFIVYPPVGQTARCVEFIDNAGNRVWSTTGDGKMAFFGATEIAQRGFINDPGGGATQDAELRAAIVSALDLLQSYGLMKPTTAISAQAATGTSTASNATGSPGASAANAAGTGAAGNNATSPSGGAAAAAGAGAAGAATILEDVVFTRAAGTGSAYDATVTT